VKTGSRKGEMLTAAAFCRRLAACCPGVRVGKPGLLVLSLTRWMANVFNIHLG
jgi:hypothetical protein